MREYVKKGFIGSVSDEHYSFMGHVYDTQSLMKNAGKVGKRLNGMGIDIAFITPT
jgi:hypothetical protein